MRVGAALLPKPTHHFAIVAPKGIHQGHPHVPKVSAGREQDAGPLRRQKSPLFMVWQPVL